jgi:hypothetical protein
MHKSFTQIALWTEKEKFLVTCVCAHD